MTIDRFAGRAISDPLAHAFEITKHDTTDLEGVTRALYVGTAGDVAVRLQGNPGTTIVFKNVPAGSLIPIRAARVMSTGTTAADMVGMW